MRGSVRESAARGRLRGLVAACLLPGWLAGCGAGGNEGPNVILITLDTTRADHLSCFGYGRRTSPNIDKLAAESVLYTRAIAPSSWTLPSHASLFTGKLTAGHGARYDPEGPFHLTDAVRGPRGFEAIRARGLAADERTLAQILKERGWATGAVVAGPWLKKVFGLNKGFDDWDDSEVDGMNGRLARQVTAAALRWLKEAKKQEKFFLFVNYFDPHSPYALPEPFSRAFLPKTPWAGAEPSVEEIRAMYDGEILYMDRYFGVLMQGIESAGLFENTLVIVVGDHGEQFNEHGKLGHGESLHREEIHVPLIVRHPGKGASPGRSDALIQVNDLFSVVLDHLGLPVPEGTQSGVPPEVGHPVVSELYPLAVMNPSGDWRSIIEDDFQFIWRSTGDHMLFDLRRDPGARANLVSREPERASRMVSRLNEFLAEIPEPGPSAAAGAVDEETKRALRDLGYVK